MDKIVSERIARERGKFADYNDLKAKAAKFDEIEAQNATELEKATKKAADEARAEMSTKTNARLIRAEVKAAAAAARFHDPADAAMQLAARFGEIKVSDDGDVDEATVKTLIDDLAQAKPYLVKSDVSKPKPLPGQGQNQPGPSSGREQGLAEAKKRFPQKQN